MNWLIGQDKHWHDERFLGSVCNEQVLKSKRLVLEDHRPERMAANNEVLCFALKALLTEGEQCFCLPVEKHT